MLNVYSVLVFIPFPLLVLKMILLSSLIFLILVCRDATITTNFWLVNRKTFVNDTLSSRGTENYYLENAKLFCKKLLSCSLAALERRSQFWCMGHLVCENKSIFFLNNYKVWVCRPAYKSINIILYFLKAAADINYLAIFLNDGVICILQT